MNMKSLVPAVILAGLALPGSAAKTKPDAPVVGSTGPGYKAVSYRAPREDVREHVPGFLLVEAEGFADYGGWRIDTQFVHKMGSAYLVANGVGDPVPSARRERKRS